MHYQPHRSEGHSPSTPLPANRPLSTRKNACIVCAVCFTCSGYYGSNCHCPEIQPRRGKNLPEGGLDSRAKKLSPLDKDDYDFTIQWLDEFTHTVYRDSHRRVHLRDLTEVSLCKAHSSTLYRAKKKHQRMQQQAPPSPADSMMEDITRHRSSSVDSYPHLPQPQCSTIHEDKLPYHENNGLMGGPLAAKVREISCQFAYPKESPDLFMITTSHSHKRKRTSTLSRPSPSASTPLYSNPPLQRHPLPPPPSSHSFSSQLPPLHLRTPSLSSLSNNLQHQLHVSNAYHHVFHDKDTNHHHSLDLPPPYTKTIETVSLKSSPTLKSIDLHSQVKENDEGVYFVKNLAITDAYTFQDLLSEIDFAGSPPAGKRLVISDKKRERIFPLGQAIRSVIRFPRDTHVEFYLGLSDKASINWNHYQ
ncbi:hypothetical protein A0J61_06460 [Choanephora cucurbitarum]|uniref:Uncharacterized protein n=1 Tax=Choanephora cucurbitarum TaxID=101091 RepID=A0A1C7N8U4_9FUNG|nr:hypothetical protein A0J61_06460 [Choanephora cucurbitarum]